MGDAPTLIERCPERDREMIYAACRIVALADGRVWREADVLDRIDDQLQLRKKTRSTIHRKVKSGRSRCRIPESDSGKRLMYEFVVQVAFADDKLTDQEQKFARRLGKRLGLAIEEIEKRLARGAAVIVKPSHPDGAAGLKPAGEFYIFQAALLMIPAGFLAL